MQVYVQKSTSTTFPRRASGVRGWELSQPVAPSKPGKWPSIGNSAVPTCRCLLKRLTSPKLLLDVRQEAPLTSSCPPLPLAGCRRAGPNLRGCLHSAHNELLG